MSAVGDVPGCDRVAIVRVGRDGYEVEVYDPEGWTADHWKGLVLAALRTAQRYDADVYTIVHELAEMPVEVERG